MQVAGRAHPRGRRSTERQTEPPPALPAPGTSAGRVPPPVTVLSVSIREMLLTLQGSVESIFSTACRLTFNFSLSAL